MRTITYTVYEYDELKTEAQEKAREWWANLEVQQPAWIEEHFESMRAAIKTAETERNIKRLRSLSIHATFTGYCADCLLADFIDQENRIPTAFEIERYFSMRWNEELNWRLSDEENIAENIRMNGYEFTVGGAEA